MNFDDDDYDLDGFGYETQARPAPLKVSGRSSKNLHYHGAEHAWGTHSAWVNTKTGEVIDVWSGWGHHDPLEANVADLDGAMTMGINTADIPSNMDYTHYALTKGWLRYIYSSSQMWVEAPRTKDAKDTIVEIVSAAVRTNNKNLDMKVTIDWASSLTLVKGGTYTIRDILDGDLHESRTFEGMLSDIALATSGGMATMGGLGAAGAYALKKLDKAKKVAKVVAKSAVKKARMESRLSAILSDVLRGE